MHDGSETISDSMILKFAVQAASPRHPLPNYFQDSLRFELRVNVTPVNDPPRLEIPNNAVLTLAQVSLFFYLSWDRKFRSKFRHDD